MYGLVRKRDGHIVYVGITQEPKQRKVEHKTNFGVHWKFLDFVVLCDFSSRSDALLDERGTIKKLKKCGQCDLNDNGKRLLLFDLVPKVVN